MIGKTVLITGAARRVGRAIALELHAAGANVLLHYRKAADDAHALASELNAQRPGSAFCQAVDLLDLGALSALCDVFYPRVWLRRARRVPAGTVGMTIYFHADAAQLARQGDKHLLAQASAGAGGSTGSSTSAEKLE